MSELKDTIVHVKYRFKPEGSDTYITAYLESALSDVLIPEESRTDMLGATNLQQFCESLMNKLQTEAPIYQRAYLYDPDFIYPKGKFLYEADTGRFKVANGITKYSDLEFFGYDRDNNAGEVNAIDGRVSLTIVDASGHETSSSIPDYIEILDTDPEPASYSEPVYALRTS